MKCPFQHPLIKVSHPNLPKGYTLYICLAEVCSVAYLKEKRCTNILYSPFNSTNLKRILEWATSIPDSTRGPTKKESKGEPHERIPDA